MEILCRLIITSFLDKSELEKQLKPNIYYR